MTINIIVQRPPADYQGESISNPLIVTTEQAIATGRAKINRYCSNRRQISCSMSLQPYLSPGKMVQVTTMAGLQYMAMIRSCTIAIDREPQGGFTALTHLVLEREAD